MTPIPLHWEHLRYDIHLLLDDDTDKEVARVWRGCGKNAWVLCVGDYVVARHKGALASAKRQVMKLLAKRMRS